MPISDQEHVDAIACAIRAVQPPSGSAIIDSGEQNLDARLAVYRNNVRSSLSRALGERFPVLEKLVGAAFFKFLAAAYFNAHPPTSPLISQYGDNMPGFIKSFEPASSYPYLADIARLEIAWLEAYHAADARPLGASEIVQAGDASRLHFSLHPSVRLVSSDYPISAIWRRNKTNAGSGEISLAGGEAVLIARPHWEVFVHALQTGMFHAVSAMAKGVTVEDALAAAIEADASFDPQIFFEAMFAYKIIIGVAVASPPDNQRTGAVK